MQTLLDVNEIRVGTTDNGGPIYDDRSVLYAFRASACGVTMMSPWFYGTHEEAGQKLSELQRHFDTVAMVGGAK
jgi:hypothetical protein